MAKIGALFYIVWPSVTNHWCAYQGLVLEIMRFVAQITKHKTRCLGPKSTPKIASDNVGGCPGLF